MDNDPFGPAILCAYAFDGLGSGRPLMKEEISDELRNKTPAWVHLNARHPDTRPWLEREVSYLDNLILDALLAEETRPRVVEFETGFLLILRGMNQNENADPEDMVSLRLWIDSERIITMSIRRSMALEDIRERLASSRGPKSTGDFLALLTTRLFERMEPILLNLHDHTDTLEDVVIANPTGTERDSIIDIRKKAMIFRRYIAPQCDVMAHLSISDHEWISPLHRRQLHEVYDRITRYLEDLDTLREHAQLVKEEIANAFNERLNRNIYLLSIMSVIFMPLTFLTGLFGMNVAGIPAAENPYAFATVSLFLFGLVFFQLLIFKRLKWF